MRTIADTSAVINFNDLLIATPDADVRTAVYREALRAGSERIAQHCPDNHDVWRAIEARTQLVDTVLRHCWETIVTDNSLALVAVGGYGRGQLHPRSDIDIMLLFESELPAEAEARVSEFVTQLWDLGLDIGHSVRSVAQCVEESLRDVTVITNLLEARLITGSKLLFETMQANTAADTIWPADQFFAAKREEQYQRHTRFQDTSYRLEPNVKESPGGMRDLQTLRWVAKRLFQSGELQELVARGFLNEDELATLQEGEDLLYRIRFVLHTIAERREDRLLFDYQRQLAHAFGFTRDENNHCIEQFMQQYYCTVMSLERLNDMLLQLFAAHFKDARGGAQITALNPRFQLSDGYIEVTAENTFEAHPSALLEIFLLAAKDPDIAGVRGHTIRLIKRHLHLIDENFRSDPDCQKLFIDILRQPQGITHQLRLMNRYGVLAAYLPAFERIVGRMQYDLFHIYTVDEHTLMVIRNMRRYFIDKHSDELPHCNQIAESIEKPELLFLMGLFHDIAKGRGGDHSELGAAEALLFCTDHGFGGVDASLVSWAVENHLLMSMTMQRRDISDPEVVYAFAQQVSTKMHLDYLYLLTIADIRSTNPELWNSWKDSLLQTLYNSTLRVLKRGLDNPINRSEIISENKNKALQLLEENGIDRVRVHNIWEDLGDSYFLRYRADEICWHTVAMLRHPDKERPLVIIRHDKRYNSTEIFIHCADQNNLFAQITAVLGRLQLNVTSARIVTSRSQRALDRFRVHDLRGQAIVDKIQLQKIKDDIKYALSLRGVLPPITEQASSRRLRLFNIPVLVEFDNEVTAGLTSVTVIASDRAGALSRIARVFLSCDVSVHAAKIATLGEKIEDVFFISHRTGKSVTEVDLLEKIEKSLIQALSD